MLAHLKTAGLVKRYIPSHLPKMMSSWKTGSVQWRFRARDNHPPALSSHFETLRQNSRWRWRAGGRQQACSNCKFRASRWWSSWSLIIWAGGRQEACSKSETVGRFLAFRDAHAFFTPPRFRMTRIWTEIDVIQNVKRHLTVQWSLQEQTLLADL